MSTLRPSTNLRLQKWRSFQRWIDRHSDGRWAFRGHGDTTFQLVPGVGRKAKYTAIDEQAIFSIFKKRVAEFVDDRNWSESDYLALAQHHGLPTRLLDWTTNPLLAAYFAVNADAAAVSMRPVTATGRVSSKTVTAIPARDTRPARIIAYAVKTSDVLLPSADPFNVRGVKFITPRSLTTRIVTQSGLFSVHEMPNIPWGSPISAPAHLFDIPPDMRAFFKRRLYYLGVEPQRIMGGLDGLGERISWQYRARVGLGALK